MAEMARFALTEEERKKYERPAWAPAIGGVRTPQLRASMPDTASGFGEAIGQGLRSGVTGAAGIATRGTQQLAGIAAPLAAETYKAATFIPRTGLTAAADIGAGVLRGAGVLPTQSQAQIVPKAIQTPPAAVAPFRAQSRGPGVTEVFTPQTQAGGIRSFTNLLEGGASPQQVAGFEEEQYQGRGKASIIPAEQAQAEARMAMGLREGRAFTEGAEDGVFGVAPTAPVESPAALAAKRQLATEQDPITAGRLREIIREDEAARAPAPTQADLETMATRSMGGRMTARTLSGLRKRAAETAALQTGAETAQLAAQTGFTKALADLQASAAKSPDLPKVALKEVQDPTNPLKLLYYLTEEGVPTPTAIDPADPVQADALIMYNNARLSGGPDARVPFNEFLLWAQERSKGGL